MVRNSIKEENGRLTTMNGLKTQDVSMNNSHIEPTPINQNIAKF